MNVDKRTVLAGMGATLVVPAQARTRLAYDLVPVQVGPGIWMIEGSRDYFSMQNGGAIVNTTMLESEAV